MVCLFRSEVLLLNHACSSIPNAWPDGSPLASAPSLQSLKDLKKNQNLRSQLNHKISVFPVEILIDWLLFYFLIIANFIFFPLGL